MAKKDLGISFQQLLNQLKAQAYHPIYVLEGEEPYFTNQITAYFEKNIIPEEERDFNQAIWYGREVTGAQVVEKARQYPMFGERQLLIVKEAGEVKDLNLIGEYFKNPMPTTILVLDFMGKKIDARTSFAKNIKGNAVHFISKNITDAELPMWIERMAAEKSLKFSPEAIQLIQIYIGNNLNKIENEVEKFAVNQFIGQEISQDLAAEHIGINKEYQVFDLPDMVFFQNKDELARMLNYFIAHPRQAAGPVVVGAFYNFISKVLLSYYNPGGNFAQDRKMGIWSKHRQVAQRYPMMKMIRSLIILEEYSKNIVGVGVSASEGENLKWLLSNLNNEMSKR